MKPLALARFRQRLAANEPVYGLWVTLESPSITEMAVALGYDWVVIDTEHGHLDWKEVVEHVRATVRSETVALVRITELSGGLIKRALDVGADGVVVPWVESAEQLRQAVAFAKYPLEGVRGIGGERATCWGLCLGEHTAAANEQVLVVPILETVKGVQQAARMTHVEGAEVFFFGPADLSASHGFRGQWEGPGVADEIQRTKDLLRAAGKHVGVLTTSIDNLHERRDQGFRMLAVGADASLLARTLRDSLASAGRATGMRSDFEYAAPGTVAAPLPRPPDSMRPDRVEVITAVGEGPVVELAPGVRFEALVGKQQQARNLTTGLVTLSPQAELPYHVHPVSESVTVLEGRVLMEVAGRAYRLGPLDNICIPAGLPHMAVNASGAKAVSHVALPTSEPTRTLVARPSSRRSMPEDSAGFSGAERVTRFRTAERFAAGPNTEFIDFFNARFLPGLEMSGGYGLFQPGGRLPAHVHDFDESICIIEGRATCIVEGRRYSMADRATAMQPRGRVHYFVNESTAAMAMIWVYAGPLPERIVVDERCATFAGDPWK